VRAQRSPYTTLGLKPGADRAAVDEAYRRLMKQQHPDRTGGDPAAAAELNTAYAALRSISVGSQSVAAVPVAGAAPAPRRRRRGRLAGLAMVAVAGAGLYLVPRPMLPMKSRVQPKSPPIQAAAANIAPESLDLSRLPDEDAIAAAVAAARRLHGGRLEGAAVSFSRSCEDDLKAYASLALLDHCIAFDAASGILGGRTPNARFRAEDMAARHVGAALRMSADPVLAEDRVGSVRRLVERLLLQPPRGDQGVPAGAGAGAGAAGLGATGTAG
jgi:hypothetical protein